MDLPTLVSVLGPTGAIVFIGWSAFKLIWPSYEKHAERRTQAEEKQAVAFERIADLMALTHEAANATRTDVAALRLDMATLLERQKRERPSRSAKFVTEGAR